MPATATMSDRTGARPHERVAELLDSMPSAFLALDREYRITYVNRMAALLAGKPSEEVIGGHIWEEFPLLGDSEHRGACSRAMEERVPVLVEGRIPTTDRWIECFAYPTDDGLATYIRDVTEEREARRRLAELEARFRAIVENATEIVTLVDENAMITYVTPTAERLLGYVPEEMQGRTVFEFIHPEDQARAVERLSTLVAHTERTVSAEVRLRRKDGSWMWSESAGRNLLADPAVRGIIATHRDISDRKEAAAALEASERRFRALIEGSADCVMIVDEEARASYMGPAVKGMLGYDPEELIGRSAFDFVHPDDLAMAVEEVRSLLDDPSLTARAELRARHKDGSWHWIETIGRNLFDEPAVGGIVVNFRDVTERKRVEEALRRIDAERRELLARLVRAHEEERERIALDIHDDTLQQLTALGMRVGMLKRVLDDPEQQQRLGETEQVLSDTMRRLRTLLFELRPPALDEQGIEAALRLYLEEQGKRFGLEYRLEVTLAPEPPPHVRVAIYRIAQEAVSNVVRHARASAVGVSVRSADDGVALEIADDGSGFEFSLRPRRERPGHLGLAAMRHRAEMVGGWVRIESAPDRGTTVRSWIPLLDPETSGGAA